MTGKNRTVVGQSGIQRDPFVQGGRALAQMENAFIHGVSPLTRSRKAVPLDPRDMGETERHLEQTFALATRLRLMLLQNTTDGTDLSD